MEIIWNNIYSDKELKLYHTQFKKMEIIKILQLDESQSWVFEGCYILNLKYNNDTEVSDYHFYTTDYFLDIGVKRMCIQPNPILDQSYKSDSESDIDQRIITWFKNCQQKFLTGIDVLGQPHGSFISENFKQLQSGVESDSIKELTEKEKRIKIIENNFYSAKNGLLAAFKLLKNGVIEILINSKKVSIFEIFS